MEAGVAEFLTEFARYLVAAGIPSPRFSALARMAYFTAASRSGRFSNSRLNQSAVAAMTGLTRVQVRDFAKTKKPRLKARTDRIETLIGGWMTDAAFLTAESRPRKLSTTGRSAAFGRLVRKYGGDVPTRSILRELARNDLVKVTDGHVSLNARARQTFGQSQLKHLSHALTQLIESSSASLHKDRPIQSMMSEIAYPSASPKGKVLVQRKFSAGLKSFAEDLRATGTTASIEAPNKDGSIRSLTRTRILLITEETTSDDSISK